MRSIHWTTPPLRGAGLFLLMLLVGACAPPAPETGPFPAFAEFAGREVAEVEFTGELVVPEDSLRDAIVTRPTRCQLLFLPVCIPGTNIGRDVYLLDLPELARDVARIRLFHRDFGYYGTQVAPQVEPTEDERVAVRFGIAPGQRTFLQELTIEGTEGIIPPEELEQRVPLQVGEPFRRGDFQISADTIQAALLRQGHAYAEVLRNFVIDTIADISEAHFVAIPGPLVHVDTILFIGTDRLEERTARRQLAVQEGDLLRATELVRSQRNLYQLGLVNFASVELAPDTLQLSPEVEEEATVLVRVVEAPRYLVDANAGYGSIDCFRTGVRHVDRNFLGGARRLEVSGDVSKIGVGRPLDMGLEGSLCRALRDDPFSERLNYRLSADFEQPRLFTARDRLGIGIHAERLSEPEIYLRESMGGQIALARDLGRDATVTSTLDVERGRTLANPIVFCAGFDVCTPEDWAALQQSRWFNALSLSAVRDRSEPAQFPVRGRQLRGGVVWASPFLGSDDRYLRVVGEGASYWQLRPGWVLASFLRGGVLLQGTIGPAGGFVPPERRFYAGGPNSVRGYAPNALGPIAYLAEAALITEEGEVIPNLDAVERSAIGGSHTVVASAELRMPSPVLSDLLRIGAFVDAGQVWARGAMVESAPIRVTPGVGFRFLTPVGPIRVDVGYNPYPREAGPLYLVDEEENLVLYDPSYVGEPRGFWERFQVHFAVGQAF